MLATSPQNSACENLEVMLQKCYFELCLYVRCGENARGIIHEMNLLYLLTFKLLLRMLSRISCMSEECTSE